LTKLSSSGAALSPAGGFTAGGLSSEVGVAVDGTGNIWATNDGPGTVAEFSNGGSVLSGALGYTGGGVNLSYAFGIAIDASGSAWVGHNNNYTPDTTLSKLSSSGAAISPASGYSGGGLTSVAGIAIDGGGDVSGRECRQRRQRERILEQRHSDQSYTGLHSWGCA
jgi:hypothetical protein